ncbi:MAG: prepilin-type N-terminal cleavage/methylation domain-containing protein [Phycisphaeraceae bacterium]|nr:prepilin-type N-terminal cleavage/methylation domain-containing protein [Phycisphaerae bacterium]MBX3391141.1 prepilin-type N-terminal cleavage/methylation domain-containing protein [Phycisphaeraceae bacterium]
MNIRRTIRKGFTLVEILIVVVILGILAAIVVPQFTNATQDAQAGNIKAQLDTLNNQLELYRARNNTYPDTDDPWGSISDAASMIGGGYLKALPVNPFNGQSSVGDDPEANGWHWYDSNGDDIVDSIGATNFDESTGEITPGVL